MIRLEYQGFHGCKSICGLEIRSLADGRTLVICTELPENKGTSVTNFAEDLPTLVCHQFGIPHDKLEWLEHYPPSPSHGPQPDWDRVTFDWNGRNLINPNWRRMQDDDWNQLGIQAPDA